MVRVIDLTNVSSAYATRLLVEAGYEVIRVEHPRGDELRRLGPCLDSVAVHEAGAFHQFLNAGKKSFSLDLESPMGRQVFMRLAQSAQVVLLPDTAGIDAQSLVAANPDLVVVITVDDLEDELCAAARSGLLYITGEPDSPPMVPGAHVCYAIVGLHVALAVSAAMLGFAESGAERIIRVSVQECLMPMLEQAMVAYQATGKVARRQGYKGAVTAVSGAFPCADGYWMLSVPPTPGGWTRLVEWIDDPVLKNDKDLESEAARQANKEMILDRIEQWSSKFTKEELVTQGQDRRIPVTPVSTPGELLNDAQLLGRGFLREIEHPVLGRLRVPMGAIAGATGRCVGHAPRLGEHTSELLQELGYTREEREMLLEIGVI